MMRIVVQGPITAVAFLTVFVTGEAGSRPKVIAVVGSYRLVAKRISATRDAPSAKLIQCEFISGPNQALNRPAKFDLDSKDVRRAARC